MIRRLTLSQRLTLVFTAILLFCAAAACGIQIYSSNQYGNVMVQRLSAGLAQQIVISEPLLDNTGQVNRQTLKILFDRLMTLNPSGYAVAKSALECATVVTATGGRVWSVGRDVGLVLGNAPSKTIDGECQQD